jgi:Na+-driven multidrug efflux pump
MTAPPTDPVAQAKGLKNAAVGLVLAGLIIGVGLPVTFVVLGIQVVMTPWGFDAIWLVPLAMMVFDFVMARLFWRRAINLERSAMQGKAP